MKRKEQRMLFLGALVACFAAAAVLVLVALEDTVTFFDTRRVGPVTHSSYEGLSVKRWGGMLYSMVMSPPAERIGIWSCRVGTCWHRSRLRARTQLLSGRLPAVSPVRPSIPLACMRTPAVKRRSRCHLQHGYASSGGADRRLVLPGRNALAPVAPGGAHPTCIRAVSGGMTGPSLDPACLRAPRSGGGTYL